MSVAMHNRLISDINYRQKAKFLERTFNLRNSKIPKFSGEML